MEHFILLIYIVVLMMASFAVGWLTLLNTQYRLGQLKSAIIMMMSLTLLMFSHMQSIMVTISGGGDQIYFVIGKTVGSISGVLTSYYLLVFIYNLTISDISKKVLYFFRIYSGLIGLFFILFPPIGNIMMIIVIIYGLVYAINGFWFDQKYLKADALKKFKRYSILIIISVVLIIFDAAIPQFPFLNERLPYGFMALPLFISLLVVIAFIEGKIFFQTNYQRTGLINDQNLQVYGITNREKEVILCIAEGASYQDVSDLLHISLSTVKTHMNNIYRKLEVSSKIEMIQKMQK